MFFSVDSGQFQKESMKFFGYDFTNDDLKPLRDLFRNIRMGYFYRLNGGGAKAANTWQRRFIPAQGAMTLPSLLNPMKPLWKKPMKFTM